MRLLCLAALVLVALWDRGGFAGGPLLARCQSSVGAAGVERAKASDEVGRRDVRWAVGRGLGAANGRKCAPSCARVTAVAAAAASSSLELRT